MKKSQKVLIHGSRVPNLTVFCVLLIEYVLCIYWENLRYGINYLFYFNTDNVNVLLLTGYAILLILITCNNHGRNVLIRYEQELSLLLKCVLTNIVYAIFGSAVYYGQIGMNIDIFIKKDILLTLLQLASIVFMCATAYMIRLGAYNGRRLYLCENIADIAIDISGIPGAKLISVSDTGMDEIRRMMSDYDEIYLYNLSAQDREDYIKICFEQNMPVYFSTKLTDMELRGAALAQDGETPIFFKSAYGMGHKTSILKRIIDIVLSLSALIILSPVFIVIAAAIKLDDGGDVFYRQSRCTKGMRTFQIIKFRSMVMGAEQMLGPKIADNRDNRMTRVGYILRKYKLDELPQLFNILKGDMSFVGPRPERPEIIEKIVRDVPEYTYRTTVPAGLTGYAQVHGDYHTEFIDKLKWDLMYIENCSLMLDLKIMLMTVMVVFRGSDDV